MGVKFQLTNIKLQKKSVRKYLVNKLFDIAQHTLYIIFANTVTCVYLSFQQRHQEEEGDQRVR